MNHGKRWVAIGVAVATGLMGLESVSPVIAGATQVELVCVGKSGDNASSLGDSKSTLGALASFSGGGGLSFSVEATPNAPEKVTPSSGPFEASFDLALTMPDSIVKVARDTLKLTTVTVKDATFSVVASGAATATLSKTIPELTVDLTKTPVVVNQKVSGTITPTSAGKISYKAGDTTLSLALNTVFSGITLNSLTVSCGSNKEIASTGVQVPGAPTVSPIIYVGGATGAWTSKQLLPGEITPDSGNPIIPGSLRIVSQAPNGGFAAVGPAGDAAFLAPAAQGLYNVTHEVCAASKVVPAVPGVNAVQSLAWPESYVGRDLNAHPFSMALQFKGVKTAPIPLSYLFGQPSPLDPNARGFFDQFVAQFQAPSAAQLQAALEGLSTIGAGNVAVTGGGATPYSITFRGALGGAEQPKIEVVDWDTWLPANGLTTLLGLLNPPAPAPGTVTTTTVPKPVETAETLDAKLAAQLITFDQWLAGRGALLQADIIAGATTPANIKVITGLFPKAPEVQTSTDGKAPVPEGATGPLCSRFDVGYFILNPPAAVQGVSLSRPASAPSASTTSSSRTTTRTTCSNKRVRVKVNGKYKYVTKRLCTKTTCVTKPVKVRVKVNGRYKTKYVNKRFCTSKTVR